MILYKGKLYETKEQERLLARLEQDINDTRIHRKLDISKVINAVDAIGQKPVFIMKKLPGWA